MKLTPHDYQLECVSAIRASYRRGDRIALVQLPTGSGKSFTAATLIYQMIGIKPDYKVLILVPKIKILREFLEVLPKGVTTVASHSYGEINTTGQFIVGTFQTLATRDLPEVDLVICDECHLLNDRDKDSQYYSTVLRLMDLNPDARILGLTATPFRDTGLIYGEGKFFPEPVFKRDLLWTTDRGFTVKAKVYQPAETFDITSLTIDNTGEYAQHTISKLVADRGKAEKQVVDIVVKTKDRKKIAIACANIEHANMISDLLEYCGEKSVVVHSKQDDDECDESLEAFETNPPIRFMTFVTMVSIGYNYPPIDCIVLLRPTRRAQLYIQTVGRGLRASPETGKVDCLVLDYGRVVENCGPLNAPYINQGGKRGLAKAMEQSPQLTIICPECGAFNFPLRTEANPTCVECESLLPVVRQKADPTDKLEDKAAIIDLYATPKKTKIVRAIHWVACGQTPEEKRRRKKLSLYFLDGTSCWFLITNPMFAEIDDKAKYDQKKWLEGLENKYEKLIRDILNQDFSIRSINDLHANAVNSVEVLYEESGTYYYKYKSHKILKNSDLPESSSSATVQDAVSSAFKVFGPIAMRQERLNSSDELFLKRGF